MFGLREEVQEEGSIPACAGEPSTLQGQSNGNTVYPRVCGGTSASCQCSPTEQGLSPRVRGNPPNVVVRCLLIRSIPACAGEPHAALSNEIGGWVYPRVCGGTLLGDSAIDGCRGLSPRVRGNPYAAPPALGEVGSIPACAGEPSGRVKNRSSPTVYPRVCGGTGFFNIAWHGYPGLSPRVRGNHR